jgi:hypothetical protein
MELPFAFSCANSNQSARPECMLERFAHDDFRFADKKLRGALFGAADYGNETIDLAAGDQA